MDDGTQMTVKTVGLLLLILIFLTCESYNSQLMIIDTQESTVILIVSYYATHF